MKIFKLGKDLPSHKNKASIDVNCTNHNLTLLDINEIGNQMSLFTDTSSIIETSGFFPYI